MGILVASAPLIEEATDIHPADKHRLNFALAHGGRRWRTSQPEEVASLLEEAVPSLAESATALRILALDGLTDALNVGAVLRVAAAFGVSAVLCSEDCCDPLNPRAIRSSAGYVFHVPVIKGPLPA